MRAGATKQWTIQAIEAEIPIKSDLINDMIFIICNMIANIRIFSFFKNMQ